LTENSQRSAVSSLQRPGELLRGWEAIAGELGVCRRTALRWGAVRGLPVWRDPVDGGVYSTRIALDRWRETQGMDAGALLRRLTTYEKMLPPLLDMLTKAGLLTDGGRLALEAEVEAPPSSEGPIAGSCHSGCG